MITLLLLFSCSSEPYSFFKQRHSCRIESYSSEELKNGIPEFDEREYIWGDGRVDFQGDLSEGYATYNGYGFFSESYQLYYDEGETRHLQEYDCTEEWCWRTKRISEYQREGRETISEVRYEWDGKTEFFYQEDGGTGYTVHNDHARAVEWYYENEFGYQEEFYEYECGDWCKLLRMNGTGVYDAPAVDGMPNSLADLRDMLIRVFEDTSEETEFSQEYEWSGNRQDFENDFGEGYTIYNEYGYAIERLLSYSSWEKREEYVWDCEE